MYRSIDTKSVLIGGLLVVLILCVVGAVPFVQPEEQGRFQIELSDSHALVLDSATGQVWSTNFDSPSNVIPSPDAEFYAPKTLHEIDPSQL